MLLHSIHGLIEHKHHEGHVMMEQTRTFIINIRIVLESLLVLYLTRYFFKSKASSSHVLNMKVLFLHATSDVLFDVILCLRIGLRFSLGLIY